MSHSGLVTHGVDHESRSRVDHMEEVLLGTAWRGASTSRPDIVSAHVSLGDYAGAGERSELVTSVSPLLQRAPARMSTF